MSVETSATPAVSSESRKRNTPDSLDESEEKEGQPAAKKPKPSPIQSKTRPDVSYTVLHCFTKEAFLSDCVVIEPQGGWAVRATKLQFWLIDSILIRDWIKENDRTGLSSSSSSPHDDLELILAPGTFTSERDMLMTMAYCVTDGDCDHNAPFREKVYPIGKEEWLRLLTRLDALAIPVDSEPYTQVVSGTAFSLYANRSPDGTVVDKEELARFGKRYKHALSVEWAANDYVSSTPPGPTMTFPPKDVQDILFEPVFRKACQFRMQFTQVADGVRTALGALRVYDDSYQRRYQVPIADRITSDYTVDAQATIAAIHTALRSILRV